MTNRFGWVVIAGALSGVLSVGCGGGSQAQGEGSGSETGGSGTGGGEVAGETDGFDMEGFEGGEPTVDHGSQSARELLGVHPPPTPWHDMNEQARIDWMVSNVLPIAAEDFRAYDAERFANMSCETCHGDNAEAVHYELPSAQLPRLAAPGSPQWEQMTHSPGYAFMNDIVTPTMATLVGEERYSAEHPDGFGCFECHTRRQ